MHENFFHVIDLFAAAIFPGILLATLYAAYTTIRCMINPKLGPVLPEDMRAASMKEVWIEFICSFVEIIFRFQWIKIFWFIQMFSRNFYVWYSNILSIKSSCLFD